MKKVLLTSLALFLLNSCSTYKPFTSTVKPGEIKQVGIFPSLNVLTFKDVDESSKINEIAKQLSQNLAVKTKDKTESVLNLAEVSYKHISLNNEEAHILDNELSHYITIFNKLESINSSHLPEILNTKKNRDLFNTIVVSDSVVNILEKNSLRYALSIITLGITRTPIGDAERRLNNTIGFAIASGFVALTGTGFWRNELPYTNSMYAIILDAKEKRLAFFKFKTELIDPLNEKLTTAQLYSCFEDYWIWYHPEAQKHLKITKK